MKVDFNGNPIKFELTRADFATEHGIDSLVWFEPGSTDKITVDEQASDSYARYASIHECICQGNYKYLAPEVTDPNTRCGEIDKMIIATMPESERRPYIEKRIEMFEALLDQNLNPSLEPIFRESLEILKSL